MLSGQKRYDAVVVGSGPNGLASAITLQQNGLSVILLEAKSTIGGGMRSAELTLPGFIHDICSTIHPMGAASPFFNSLPLEQFGLEWIYSPYALAHPLDNGKAVILEKSVTQTASRLGTDEKTYLQIMGQMAKESQNLIPSILAPLKVPDSPLALANFGIKAIQSAVGFSSRNFKEDSTKALFAGLAAHSILPLEDIFSNAIGMALGLVAHSHGWPMAKGGSQKIADALLDYFVSLGGEFKTNYPIRKLNDLPSAKVVMLDLTPPQILNIFEDKLPFFYRKQLQSYIFGPGVFKIDWALKAPAPFASSDCTKAATVHIGGLMEEIALSESAVWKGQHPDRPFVLFAQQSCFDTTRSPEGMHTAWAYCHVPKGSHTDMTLKIENQIERFAPGFRDLIIQRHIMNTEKMQEYNSNYIGGDITGGAPKWSQLFTRPVLSFSPYSIPVKGMYICSSSTPPGGGVHGMCGFYAARRALRDVFKVKVKL